MDKPSSDVEPTGLCLYYLEKLDMIEELDGVAARLVICHLSLSHCRGGWRYETLILSSWCCRLCTRSSDRSKDRSFAADVCNDHHSCNLLYCIRPRSNGEAASSITDFSSDSWINGFHRMLI
ncbi:uncharacterized protein LOC143913830 [Arctopsyche grandis]|uniref:uncharacterized protein LOC143913830 n=1 Tax=Arctopsyche grandis TaxID=121162 RepID=UPI00406D8491